MIKITTVDSAALWTNPKAIVAVVIPSLLSKETQCKIMLTGALVDVSRQEANDILASLQTLDGVDPRNADKG